MRALPIIVLALACASAQVAERADWFKRASIGCTITSHAFDAHHPERAREECENAIELFKDTNAVMYDHEVRDLLRDLAFMAHELGLHVEARRAWGMVCASLEHARKADDPELLAAHEQLGLTLSALSDHASTLDQDEPVIGKYCGATRDWAGWVLTGNPD